MCCKKSPRSLGTSKAGGLQSRFAARRQTVQFCVGCCLTRVVEKVGSFENVSFMDVWLDSVVAVQVLLALIHLTTLYHLQPLRVVPAKLFTLNFLSPFFIIFLLKTINYYCISLRRYSLGAQKSAFTSWEENRGASLGSEDTLMIPVQNYFVQHQ